MDEKRLSNITLYTLKLIDQTITPEEFEDLNSMVSSNVQAARHYNRLMLTVSNFQGIGKELISDESTTENDLLEKDFWKLLADYEKKAPSVQPPSEKPQRELIQKVIYPPREKAKTSKHGMIFLALNVAAILFFVLFIKFAPPKGGLEVATLTDSINAKWADSGMSMQRGIRLYNDKAPLLLKEGFVEIKFDNNVRVTIEGPAEFQIIDNDMLKLNYGQLYSQVPAEAYGFQVSTQHAKIIDLGTEFGIKEEIDGDAEVHVIKGQVNFVSGILSKKINVDLLAGSARKLIAETGELEAIPCQDNLFARQIESKKNIIWRGQKYLDMADIVGGGNGLGTGHLGSGIDAASGVYTAAPTRVEFPRVQCQYNPVQSNPFIDGVFVPDGDEETVILNSHGQGYTDFPVTNGIYRSPITHGPAIRDRQRFPSRSLTLEFYLMQLEMDGILYGTPANPAIYMHTNVGITFDLDAIRRAYGNHAITHFESICGIPEKVRQKYTSEIKNPEKTTLALYVFLDDQCQLLKTFNNASKPEKIRIPIDLNARFLTFAVVDTEQHPDYDWCLLGNPLLEFE